MANSRNATELRGILRREMPVLQERYGVESLGLFGSYARGEAGPESDLDVLVCFRRSPGLFQFMELENYLSDLLRLRVDLVLANALKPNIRQRVLAELEPI